MASRAPTATIWFSVLLNAADPTVPVTCGVVMMLAAPCVTAPVVVKRSPRPPDRGVRFPRIDTPPAPATRFSPPETSSVAPASTRMKLPASSVRLRGAPSAVSPNVTEDEATIELSACTVTSPTMASSEAGVTTVPGPVRW